MPGLGLVRLYSTTSSTPLGGPSTSPPSPPPPEEPPKTLAGKLRAFFRKYGKLGIAVYLGISAVTFSSIYVALRSGVDVKGLMRKVGVPESPLLDGAGTVAMAYALYKLLMPARIFLTVVLTTWISKRTRWGIPPSTLGKGEGKR